ncbi:hypothetical protein [Luteimonas sp. 9C]|nr:hypothetical protein [Luteimonas sp. 9C]
MKVVKQKLMNAYKSSFLNGNREERVQGLQFQRRAIAGAITM